MFTNGHRTVFTDLKTNLTNGRAENCMESCVHFAFLHSHLMLLNVFAKSALCLVKETTERFSLCISSNSHGLDMFFACLIQGWHRTLEKSLNFRGSP